VDYDLYVRQHTDKGHKAINKQREYSAVPNLNETGVYCRRALDSIKVTGRGAGDTYSRRRTTSAVKAASAGAMMSAPSGPMLLLLKVGVRIAGQAIVC
jgi:hypothetical protein